MSSSSAEVSVSRDSSPSNSLVLCLLVPSSCSSASLLVSSSHLHVHMHECEKEGGRGGIGVGGWGERAHARSQAPAPEDTRGIFSVLSAIQPLEEALRPPAFGARVIVGIIAVDASESPHNMPLCRAGRGCSAAGVVFSRRLPHELLGRVLRR